MFDTSCGPGPEEAVRLESAGRTDCSVFVSTIRSWSRVMSVFRTCNKSLKKSMFTRCANRAIPRNAAGSSGVGFGFFSTLK